MSPAGTWRRLLLTVALAASVVAACGGTSSGSPAASPSAAATAVPATPASPPATASVAPSVAPTPSATWSAAPSTGPDPAEGLAIAPPYSLAPLDPALETTFRQQFLAGAGALGGLIAVGGRDVVENGALVGFVFVIELPPGVMSDATYRAMLSGIEASSELSLAPTTIAGTEVSVGDGPGGTIGIYRDGDRIDMVTSDSKARLNAVAKALIVGNR